MNYEFIKYTLNNNPAFYEVNSWFVNVACTIGIVNDTYKFYRIDNIGVTIPNATTFETADNVIMAACVSYVAQQYPDT